MWNKWFISNRIIFINNASNHFTVPANELWLVEKQSYPQTVRLRIKKYIYISHPETDWELNPTGVGDHIYCHPRTDCFVVSQLFSGARHARFPKLGSKPGWLKRQSKIPPLSHEETSARKGNLNVYVSH